MQTDASGVKVFRIFLVSQLIVALYSFPAALIIFKETKAKNVVKHWRGEQSGAYGAAPKLVAARKRCGGIVSRLNCAEELTRRELAEYWKEYVDDITHSFKCSFNLHMPQ